MKGLNDVIMRIDNTIMKRNAAEGVYSLGGVYFENVAWGLKLSNQACFVK